MKTEFDTLTVKMGYAKVVKGLLEACDKLKEAQDGAMAAKDESLFGQLHHKQSELWTMISRLIKD